MNNNHSHLSELSTVSLVTGVLYYYRPIDYSNLGVDALLSLKSDENSSPLLQKLSDTLSLINQCDFGLLTQVHDEYFMGIGDVAMPPWASVYLDKECVVFGESTGQYEAFLKQAGLEFDTQNNDPLDHIGLMLMTLSNLLECAQEDSVSKKDGQQNNRALQTTLLKTFLGTHLLPWVDFYLNNLTDVLATVINETNSESHNANKKPCFEAYASLIHLTQNLLVALSEELVIEVAIKNIYFRPKHMQSLEE